MDGQFKNTTMVRDKWINAPKPHHEPPLFGAKPLPEPMSAYCQLDSWEQISGKFESEFYHFHSKKCIWNCRLPKWRPFCPGGDELMELWSPVLFIVAGWRWYGEHFGLFHMLKHIAEFHWSFESNFINDIKVTYRRHTCVCWGHQTCHGVQWLMQIL